MPKSQVVIRRREAELLGEEILAQRFNGESPDNETSTWERRAIKARQVFFREVNTVLTSLGMGHVSPEAAIEILVSCRKGVEALMELNDETWKPSTTGGTS